MEIPLSALPSELLALMRERTGPLKVCSIRLDQKTVEYLEALEDILHRPSRGALLRYLVVAGLDATFERLARIEARTKVPGPFPLVSAESKQLDAGDL
jgi:hypothetical protein